MRAGDLFHDLLELALEHGDGVLASFFTEGPNAVHEGAAEEGELCSAGEGAGDVGPGADAAVQHEGGAMAEVAGELGEGLDGGLAAVELSPAVIGDDHAIHAEAEGLLGILGGDDAFDDEAAFPFVADGMDAGDIEAAGEGLVHEEAEVFHGETLGDIGLHGLELGDAGKELAEGPGGAEGHLKDVPQGHAGRDGETVANFLGPVGEGRSVGEDDEHRQTRIGGALEELVA